ncbi:MAG: citrate synthase [Myxococcales bacterium]|nr:citrate synthase [Myxococcales bacterium]
MSTTPSPAPLPLPTANGLEGVVVADTELSAVDGEAGSLILRGRPVEALAGVSSLEAIAHLLWTGEEADPAAEAALRRRLGEARVAAFARLPALGDALQAAHGMDALRAALSHLSAPDGGGDPIAVTAATATFAAAWIRARAGLAPIAPDPARPHAEDYLRMALGTDDAAAARAVDAYLATVIDHGMNASTFAARVVASTGSDLVSAVVAGVAALKGPLHGGAPGPVLDMLDAIGEPARADAWLRAELAAGRRIMGMGHRIYRVRDPRAAVLERQATLLAAAPARQERLALARAVEARAEAILGERRPERRLRANVEFYTAIVLEAVGLPREAFSPTFAVGRVIGWCAHVDEQRRRGRLIRPRARYVGPRPGAADPGAAACG